MTTPLQLTEDYIFARDLREATAKIYHASTKALLKHFGATPIEEIDHRAVLSWRKTFLTKDKSKRSWNTYSSHLRTIWGYAIKHGMLTHTQTNPFKETCVTPAKRASKTIDGDVIQQARNWLNAMEGEERCTHQRSQITPAWFWLAVFEVFYYTGIRLNALLHVRYKDIDWDAQMILIRGETEKTHREFSVPIMPGLAPHIRLILDKAKRAGFCADDQLFNVNRFSRYYRGKEMTLDQVEAMYTKLTTKMGARITPHRFRHTLASDLMKQPERNIHLTKNLLNHSNLATTMSYIEVDYGHMREVLHERSVVQGALRRVRREDTSIKPLPHTESHRLSNDSTAQLPPPKALEQMSKAIGLSCGFELEQILSYVAARVGRPNELISRETPPPSELSAINALLTSPFKNTTASTSGAMVYAAGPTKNGL
ncbi:MULTISPECIES: site-specific integrase [Pseudomonadaceae]|uniref:Tyrosine-type recombinase/integrase n=1 Tax=Pseudomonas gessardii TaxID=78544 RepID=A0A7Y1QKP8_9PSED|nr:MULTISPECIES: site-specific integrase [Pseudomonadaceae]MCQ4320690.1 site-specific integrase [Stutzerimonas stutzeri]NNA94954.1 tyrosine-type recombinase/integrase [Pseudomonas gessardii]